jgi:hypothetical protein
MTNNWQIEKYFAANVPQIPGGATDRHWSMIENLRHSCRRFLLVWLTDIDLWSKICGIRAADFCWCDWQTLIYDQKSAAFVPQISVGVTDRCRMTDGWCNPALLHPQIGYIICITFLTCNIYFYFFLYHIKHKQQPIMEHSCNKKTGISQTTSQ